MTLAVAVFAFTAALAFLVVHPSSDFKLLGGLVNQQNQQAKTGLYLFAFLVLLPTSLILVPRICDEIARGPNAAALTTHAALLAGTLAAVLIAVKASRSLPWGNGVAPVLVGTGLWTLAACVSLDRARRRAQWTFLLRCSEFEFTLIVVAGVFLLGTLLCLTQVARLSAPAVALGLAGAVTALLVRTRIVVPRITRRWGLCLDALIAVIILLAVPDLVIFHASAGAPNPFFEPGIVQSQHDFFLGPTNQLLAGGTLLVNSPGSQYGVGSLYFLAAWFHLVQIGYGTFGLLDGILTALFYVAGYVLLRLAGAGRIWAGGALALGVVGLVYHFQYRVGVLPEQGPLRFGLPMLVLLGAVLGARNPAHRRAARALVFSALGISAVWAIETFGFTLVTFAAVMAMEAWLLPTDGRRRWLGHQALLGIAACVLAQLLFAAATFAGSGHLPDWGQYYAYVQAFLLGGQAGQVTYGFADWSPALAVGVALFASAAAIGLLTRWMPAAVRRERVVLIALAGTTAYSIALFSYIDNRSSTYLLPYVALPTLLAAVLWLRLIVGPRGKRASRTATACLAFGLAVAVLLVGAAWPVAVDRVKSSALAYAYPGGGFSTAINRLLHPPPIDPRTPVGVRLLHSYIPGTRALILLAAAPDLGTEILMHSRRANVLAIGDPGMDSYVPSNWTGLIGSEISKLRPGTRLLTDAATLAVNARLLANPALNPLAHPFVLGGTQLEWILQRLDQRFRLQPIYRDRQGFVVAELRPR